MPFPCVHILQMLVFLFFFFAGVPIHAGEPRKILLTVAEGEQGRDAESLLAKDFIGSGFQVVLPEHMTPSKWITARDLSEATKGKVCKLRKAAAFSGAGLIFEGRIRTTFNSEELLGMKMEKAVTTITYKLLSTASGKILKTDCKTFREVNRSSDEARQGALEKMRTEITETLIRKIPIELTSCHEKAIEEYRKSLEREKQRQTASSTSESRPSGQSKSTTRDTVPPEIILISPVQNDRDLVLTLKNLEIIEGQVKDDSPLVFFRINNEDTEVNGDGFFSKAIVLKKGDCKFILEALDNAGNRAIKEFSLSRKPNGSGPEARAWATAKMPTLWGLSIGVSKYGSTAVDLKYAHLDAQSLSRFLKDQEGNLFKEVHFKTLVNQEVTRDVVLKTISSHLGKASENDVAFIFIAGHGIKHSQTGSYYFMPYDADFNTALSKGLRMSDFNEAINILSKNVRKVIVAMDTCHAGAIGGSGERAMGGGEDLTRVLEAASGRFILAASKGGEASLENEKFKLHEGDSGHGAFTYALIKGMSGESDYDGDLCITLQELSHYVAKQVPRLTDGCQHPYFRSEGTDMPFILLGKEP